MRGTRIRGLMQAMLRVGVIGFGGGNALIPVMEKEFVTKKLYVTKEEYDEAVLAASITPTSCGDCLRYWPQVWKSLYAACCQSGRTSGSCGYRCTVSDDGTY